MIESIQTLSAVSIAAFNGLIYFLSCFPKPRKIIRPKGIKLIKGNKNSDWISLF